MLLLEGHTTAVYALAFSPDGRLMASGARDGALFVWNEALDHQDLPEQDRTNVNAIAFHLDGLRLFVGSDQGLTEYVRSDGHAYQMVVVRGPEDYDRFLAVSVTGVRFLTSSLLTVGVGSRAKPGAGLLELWDVNSGKRKRPRFSAPHGVRSVDVHPRTNRVAWSEWDRRLFVWDQVKPDPVRFNLMDNAVSVAFHPDGELLAASQQWGVKLFDLTRRQEKAHLKGHKGQVTSVAFSPDGRTLATGSWDGTVRFWDPGGGREIACYQWPTGKVYALAFAPDGLRIAAAGEKGSIVVWDLD